MQRLPVKTRLLKLFCMNTHHALFFFSIKILKRIFSRFIWIWVGYWMPNITQVIFRYLHFINQTQNASIYQDQRKISRSRESWLLMIINEFCSSLSIYLTDLYLFKNVMNWIRIVEILNHISHRLSATIPEYFALGDRKVRYIEI